jgi:hypothetical protein
MGSDHDVHQDSSFGIPAIYMNDWPDRYIHTNLDSAANIDSTKLKRAAFIGAASGYFLAKFSSGDVASTQRAIAMGQLVRAATALARQTKPGPSQDCERAVLGSLEAFRPEAVVKTQRTGQDASIRGADILRRTKEPRGPLAVFGYDYFSDHAKSVGVAPPRLLSFAGSWGTGEEYAYEALNFADGRHAAQQMQMNYRRSTAPCRRSWWPSTCRR